MRSMLPAAFSLAALVIALGTSAWTIREVRKSNLAIYQLSYVLNAKIDRLRPSTVVHEHSEVRRFMIAAHLARAVNPIVVLGDSITEAATLPSTICGHAVVNAGIGGADVSDLSSVAPSLLAGKAPALVVVAIGTNDAYVSDRRVEQFGAAYAKLLQSIANPATKLAVASIPPIAANGFLTIAAKLKPELVDRFNSLLPGLAERAGASFIDAHKALTDKGPPETIDGVHLAPSAYDLWDAAMLAGIKKALACEHE